MIAIADVAVSVKDAKASAAWWAEKMGFESHTLEGPKGHAVMVAPPGERYVLHLCEGFEPVDPGNTGIALVTDELDDCVRRLEAGGVTITERHRNDPDWGSVKFADPDGNIFWLLGAPTPFIRAQTAKRARSQAPSKPRARRGRQVARRARSRG